MALTFLSADSQVEERRMSEKKISLGLPFPRREMAVCNSQGPHGEGWQVETRRPPFVPN